MGSITPSETYSVLLRVGEDADKLRSKLHFAEEAFEALRGTNERLRTNRAVGDGTSVSVKVNTSERAASRQLTELGSTARY